MLQARVRTIFRLHLLVALQRTPRYEGKLVVKVIFSVHDAWECVGVCSVQCTRHIRVICISTLWSCGLCNSSALMILYSARSAHQVSKPIVRVSIAVKTAAIIVYRKETCICYIHFQMSSVKSPNHPILYDTYTHIFIFNSRRNKHGAHKS